MIEINMFHFAFRWFRASGAGAVQSGMIVFGVEQIQESKKTSHFFEKYVIVVNTSAIITTFTFPKIYENNPLYYIAYPLAALSLLIGALVFILGRRYYIYRKPFDSVLSNCIPVIICAFRTWYKYRSNSSTLSTTNSSTSLLRYEVIRDEEHRLNFLDYAKAENHGIYPGRIVDDVKSLGNAIVVFTLLIPYWLIFNQVQLLLLSYIHITEFFACFFFNSLIQHFANKLKQWNIKIKIH